MKNPKVSIVGAGLVGSLFSCYLARRGYRVDVFERRPDMRKEKISAGKSINLAMSTRGWTALEKAGLRELLEPLAIPMHSRMIHQADGSVDIQAYGKEGEAIYSISRGDLNKMMMQVAEQEEGVNFHFNKKCIDLDFEKDLLKVEDNQTKKISEYQSDLIFATDGAFSAVRYKMQKTNRFSYSQEYLKHGYKELEIPATAEGQHRIPTNYLHIWPRESFMLIALPNLDGSFTVTLFMAFEGKHSFENLKTDQEILEFFQTYFPTALKHMPNILQSYRENPIGSLVSIKSSPWIHKNVCLMGDAAHAIVPFYGQGMNSGFEDCRIFDELIDKHEATNWQAILNEYNDLRVQDGHAIADLAIRHFINMRDDTQSEDFLKRKQLEKVIMKNIPEFLPQYSMVSFSNIRYSIALKKGDAQIEMLKNLLKEHPNQEEWETENVLNKVKLFLNNYA